MGQRVIECQVVASYITGDGVPVGSVGSHGAVVIALDFSNAGAEWEGLIRSVTFTDALGGNPVNILLDAYKAEDREDLYFIPVPGVAMAIAGKMGMSAFGVELSGETEVVRATTETAYFRVLPSNNVLYDGDMDVPASAAEQIQGEIDDILDGEICDSFGDVEDALASVQEALESKVSKSDGTASNLTMTSWLDMNFNTLKNLANPSGSRDAVHLGWLNDKLALKQDSLHYDDVPTSGSPRVLTSGVVYTALTGKLSLTGGTMQGPLEMDGYAIYMGDGSIRGLAAPVNLQDAVNLAYVQTALSGKLPTSGGSLSGALVMGGYQIRNLGGPTDLHDAATKQYVDNAAAPEVMWCEYGETTFDEIDDALEGGRIPLCLYGGKVYVYARKAEVTLDFRTGHFFAAVDTYDDGSSASVTLLEINCDTDDSWYEASFTLATQDYVDSAIAAAIAGLS